MEITETKAPLAPPNILVALRGGFDAIANQIYLILIPILLDVWLWLGPHIQIKSLMTDFIESLTAMPSFDASQSGGLLPANPETWLSVVERVNLMTLLRSYPIGIPSLISGSLPLQTPSGSPLFVDVSSPLIAAGLWAVFTVLGLLAGTFYFILVAQAALHGKVNWRNALMEWPRRAPQVIFLALTLAIILVALLVPSSCILSFVTLGGIPLNQIGILLLGVMLLWILFPLIFAPHGIFALRINLLAAVQRSILLTRMNMASTSIFFLLILVGGQGLDALWRAPAENSWLTLVGLAGHGFAASSLLAATFLYFRDADLWAQNLVRKIRLSGSK